MATRLYPPITEDVLSAFCLTHNYKKEKTGATITINFELNKAVAMTEIGGIVLRLRTISTNKYIITENINPNTEVMTESRIDARTEGYAISKNLTTGTCIFQITSTYNPDVIDQLHIGQYYKAQLAFVDLNGVIGYWSTVATIKCVAKPTVTIANYDSSDSNIFTNEILGLYVQDTSTGDSSEKVYSYRFQLWESLDQEPRADTGICLHNSSADTSSFSSTDTFICQEDLADDKIYYLQYSVTTINGLKAYSPVYQVISGDSLDLQDNLTLVAKSGLEDDFWNYYWFHRNLTWAPWEEGVIMLYPEFADNIEKHLIENKSEPVTGNFVILRSSSKDNFKTWQEIKRFRLAGEIPYTKIIYDHTVEQGITYRYAMQQYNRAGFYSKKVLSCQLDYSNNPQYDPLTGDILQTNITADFEDMFLYDGERQLKIRFNPKVNSFKNSLQEQKIDTIGSKHPFIFRNGNICYKEFPISGLISFQEDNAYFFLDDNDKQQMGLDRFGLSVKNRYQPKIDYRVVTNFPYSADNYYTLYQRIVGLFNNDSSINAHEDTHHISNNTTQKIYYKPIKTYEEALELRRQGISLYELYDATADRYADIDRTEVYEPNDLTSQNIMTERYFKLKVLDWLTDGKPKLFRSPTEGNYIVRLLNVSLTPKTELGRMIHEFTCTAYEIADFNYQSLVDLGLLNIQEVTEEESQWYSQNIVNLFKEEPSKDGYYNVDLRERTLVGVSCTGFAPGDQLKIITETDPVPLYITIGQSGTYIYEESHKIISLSIKPMPNTEDLSRSLLLATTGYTYQKFDIISSIYTKTKIGEQLIGPVKDYFAPAAVVTTDTEGNIISDGPLGNVNAFEKSRHLYLEDSFQKIILNENTYEPNKYYIKKYNSNNYILSENEFQINQTYYERNFDAVKIRPTEILHLHAKRREIIPIFMADLVDRNYDVANSQDYMKDLTEAFAARASLQEEANMNSIVQRNMSKYFMLTPFGNGYIRRKAIAPNRPGQDVSGYAFDVTNLTSAERTEAMSITDLVAFAINKCNKDIFCLFEVYVPISNENGIITWKRFKDTWRENAGAGDIRNSFLGIYDPWLVSQKLNETDNISADGWWRTADDNYSMGYDPTFSYNNHIISLADTVEFTGINLEAPESLRVGNGVVLEIIYRLTYTDYILENENSKLRKLKDLYLALEKEATFKMARYRTNLLSKTSGDVLVGRYTALLQQALDYNDYRSVVQLLAERAQREQAQKIYNYLLQEKVLMLNAISQIKNIDIDLREQFGESYSSSRYRIYTGDNSGIASTYANYQDFITNKGNSVDIILDTVDNKNYALSSISKTFSKLGSANAAREKGKKEVVKYYTHMINNDYNIITAINTIIWNLEAGFINQIKNELDDLGTKRYVAQYITEIEQNAKDLFFTPSGIENSVLANKTLASLISKRSHPEEVQSVSILNTELWDKKFHSADINEDEYEVLPLLNLNTLDHRAYSIDNLNKYYPLGSNSLSINYDNGPKAWVYQNYQTAADIISLFNNTTNVGQTYIRNNANLFFSDNSLSEKNIFTLMNWLLNKINTNISNGDQALAKEEYKNNYGFVYNANTEPPNLDTDYNGKNNYQLLYVDVNNGIVPNASLLQAELISLKASGVNWDIDNIWAILSNKNWITRLPEAGAVKMQTIVKNLVTQYMSPAAAEIIMIYNQAVICQEYLNEHENELSEEQIHIIKGQIKEYGNSINTKKRTALIEGNSNCYYNKLIAALNTWHNDFVNIKNLNDTNTKIIPALNAVIELFNTIIIAKNKAVEQLRLYRSRLYYITEQYSISDNIKDILQDEIDAYENAKNILLYLRDNIANQLELLQSDVLFSAYLDFLELYLDYLLNMDETETNNINKYQQLLQTALNLQNSTINEEDSPQHQNELIDNAWKTFLQALAIVYRQEVKGKIGI